MPGDPKESFRRATALIYLINNNPNNKKNKEALVKLLHENPKLCTQIDEDYRGQKVSLLYKAVLEENMYVIDLLLDHGSDPNIRDPDTGLTPLSALVNQDKGQTTKALAEKLLEKKACWKNKDKDLNTLYYLAASNNNLSLIETMAKYGANPLIEYSGVYDEYVLNKVVTSCQIKHTREQTTQLLVAMFSHTPKYKNLIIAICNKDIESINKLLKEETIYTNDGKIITVPDYFLKNALEQLFIFSTKIERFSEALALYKHPNGIQLYQINKSTQLTEKDCIALIKEKFAPDIDDDKVNWSYPEGTSEAKKQALQKTFEDIAKLLLNPKRCFELLSPLDKAIQDSQECLSFDFSTIKCREKITAVNSFWPAEYDVPRVSTHHLFRFLLREQLNKYGIDAQDPATFSGFVKDPIAKDLLVNEGGLFKEQFLRGTVLSHGIYSHYLQWYIISRGVEDGDIKLEEGLSLRDVLTATVEVYNTSQQPLWVVLLDFIDKRDDAPLDFGSPYRLNSALLTTDELPYLSGLYRHHWYKNINKYQTYYEEKFGISIPYECVVLPQIYADKFNTVDPFANSPDIEDYYKEHSKSPGKLNPRTNVIRKDRKMLFSFWESTLKLPENQDETNARKLKVTLTLTP